MSDTTASRRPISTERRRFLRAAGAASVTLGAAAMLGGCETWDSMLDNPPPPRRPPQAQAQEQPRQDLAADAQILNNMLRTEHEINAAYQIALESRRVARNVVPAVQLFQSHHRDHREGLIATIRAFGAEPVAAKPMPEYAQALDAASLRTQADVLRMLARLEQGAANTYIGQIAGFQDRRLATVTSRIAADDVMHWTALAGLMQEQLPSNALSFGT